MESSFKPRIEIIKPQFGYSFYYQRYDESHPNPTASAWHYHPEFELVYVNEGAGKRQVGTHLSHYRNGDLILIGSNLPHCGFTRSLRGNQRETLIQWRMEAFGEGFFHIPELKSVLRLFERAKSGMVFHGEDKRTIGAVLESMQGLEGPQRLLTFFKALTMMASAQQYTVLNAGSILLEAKVEDQEKINRIFNYVKENFNEEIPLADIAAQVFLTPSSFCKYFKKITNKTFVQYLIEYRLIHAAKLLHETNLAITDICYECGFNNYSHFNKKFKDTMGRTPLQYRNELRTTSSVDLASAEALLEL
ncbi:AraC-type DNA-binding protein [Arachidicoccus rhizosphaerae]|jgi:AraC-like DNA-binding protein|uniref:AraC-type DNA-binding protein n=1 Tax=Arachidicoccus rhizosphaerae TaxID=551991 RepID=A0A1H3VI31_9BACT|nr:AraC family transcriptional regulator [Arachidicoccus rhizosphaerae]SDZ74331.1 AraC-type DNA-binding protein [Arachidicoccus rhizosphaerae]